MHVLVVTLLWVLAVDGVDRGIILCASDSLAIGVIRVIFQTKVYWKSTLPIVVYHCNELSQRYITEILSVDNTSVSVENLCKDNNFYMQHQARFQGYMCKVGALIESPFPETMLIDHDVVWLLEPSLLYDAPGYKHTGTLLFRDRASKWKKYHLSPGFLRKYLVSEGVNITSAVCTDLARRNDVSLYWYYMNGRLNHNKSFPYPGHFGDSSVLLLDKASHPKTIQILKRNVVTFKLGYGDKEIYWTSLTIANEPMYFEQYMAGQYGNCHGVILHFDPRVANESLTVPFYINAENRIDRVQYVGMDVDDVQYGPVLLRPDLNRTVFEDIDVRAQLGCTCIKFPCDFTTKEYSLHLLFAQWLKLALEQKLSAHEAAVVVKGRSSPCVVVQDGYMPRIRRVLSEMLSASGLRVSGDCSVVGCVEPDHAPYRYALPGFHDSRLGIDDDSKNYSCIPVTFDKKTKLN